MASFGSATVHVGRDLGQTVADRSLQTGVENLALDHKERLPFTDRPDNQQVGASPAQAALPFDPAVAMDDPLQERLEQQLRARLPGGLEFKPMLRMPAIELLEGR